MSRVSICLFFVALSWLVSGCDFFFPADEPPQCDGDVYPHPEVKTSCEGTVLVARVGACEVTHTPEHEVRDDCAAKGAVCLYSACHVQCADDSECAPELLCLPDGAGHRFCVSRLMDGEACDRDGEHLCAIGSSCRHLEEGWVCAKSCETAKDCVYPERYCSDAQVIDRGPRVCRFRAEYYEPCEWDNPDTCMNATDECRWDGTSRYSCLRR